MKGVRGKAKGGVGASSSTGVGIDSASQTVVDEECLWDPEGGARHEMSASGAALKAIEKDAAELERWASLCTKCRAYGRFVSKRQTAIQCAACKKE